MAINYTTLQVQFAALLVIARKQAMRKEHALLSDNANYDRRLLVQASGFSTSDNQENVVLGNVMDWLNDSELPAMRDRIADLRSACIEDREQGLAKIIMEDLGLSESDLGTSEFIDYVYDSSLTDGTIAIKERRGILGALRRDMELAAIGQYVTANAVGFGAFTALAANVGTLAVTSMTGESHCPAGTLYFECVDDTVDAPKLAVNLIQTVEAWDGRTFLAGDNRLTCEKSWQDGPTGITCVLTRSGLASPTEVADASNLFATVSFGTPKERDSNKGIFYIRVTRQNEPDWLIEFFADAAFTRKVGHFTSDGVAGTETFTAQALNGGTTVTFTFSRANAAAAMAAVGNTATATYNILTPRLGDKWYRATTNNDAGNFSTCIRELWPGSLPIAGANLWTDALAAALNTPTT